MQDKYFEAAKEAAKRAKTVKRMLFLVKDAGGDATEWFMQHYTDIIAFVEAHAKLQEGEELQIPESIDALFQSLPYSVKKKEINDAYDTYWDAWKGSSSKGVMLARLNTFTKDHGLTEETNVDDIRMMLCDQLSKYSERLIKLERNKWYIA